jgi:UDP-N-acetylglucosamine 4,6-dehydratase/5-epimerase
MNYFNKKTLLITGGTGSFGSALLKKFSIEKTPIKEIRIFSRDEKKQDDLRKKYKNFKSKLKFIIGDVRDISSINQATDGVDFIFHAAALKQVPSCEFYPMEAIKTNIIGTNNVLTSAISNNVKKVIVLSTDKAVYPINSMGMSKALMEKIAISKSLLNQNKTEVCVTRYGNVMGSRGSVIPLMIEQIKNKKPITITDKSMTRFLMTLDDAMDLVFFAFKNGKNGQTFIKKTNSSLIIDVAEALKNIFRVKKHPIKIIGIRHGEKIHETLIGAEERSLSKENKEFFILNPDLRDLNYNKFYNKGKIGKKLNNYSSDSGKLLSVNKIAKVLSKLDFVKKYL